MYIRLYVYISVSLPVHLSACLSLSPSSIYIHTYIILREGDSEIKVAD